MVLFNIISGSSFSPSTTGTRGFFCINKKTSVKNGGFGFQIRP